MCWLQGPTTHCAVRFNSLLLSSPTRGVISFRIVTGDSMWLPIVWHQAAQFALFGCSFAKRSTRSFLCWIAQTLLSCEQNHDFADQRFWVLIFRLTLGVFGGLCLDLIFIILILDIVSKLCHFWHLMDSFGHKRLQSLRQTCFQDYMSLYDSMRSSTCINAGLMRKFLKHTQLHIVGHIHRPDITESFGQSEVTSRLSAISTDMWKCNHNQTGQNKIEKS